ncbi:MAG: Fe(3+) ABC transporter substrate-binding protein, partial [Thiotrichales bacterium]|nr:Fe(3+) ABC transporter substrate-binding protein [Thiotrichales bacterium]
MTFKKTQQAGYAATILAAALSLLAPMYAYAQEVVVYSSRTEHLIKPVFEAFTQDTGI